MVTWSVAGRQSLLGILARRLRGIRITRQAVSVLAVIFRFALTVAGLGLLSWAAWMLAVPAGIAAAGMSCLVLEWMVKRE